jgi:hypothetical protein
MAMYQNNHNSDGKPNSAYSIIYTFVQNNGQ